MKINKNYQFIIDNHFTIDIRSGSEGYAVMYLVQAGKRLDDKKVYFRDNKQSRDKLIERLPEARDFTHLGNALSELKQIAAKMINQPQQEKETI
jgi:hypothetical protein